MAWSEDSILGLTPEFVENGADWFHRFAFQRAQRIGNDKITLGMANWLGAKLWCMPPCETTGQPENGFAALPLAFSRWSTRSWREAWERKRNPARNRMSCVIDS